MASRPFTVRWDVDCAGCGRLLFGEEDEARFNDDGDLVGEECCSDADVEDDGW